MCFSVLLYVCVCPFLDSDYLTPLHLITANGSDRPIYMC